MNTYKVKLEVDMLIEAFNETDVDDYIHDIFDTDDEIKSVKILKIVK